jgi:hypothetical protein
MTTWSNELSRIVEIVETDDLHISPLREDGKTYGTPTWIWSVVVDGALYVRAYNGKNSRWHQAAIRQKAGRITAAGITKEVSFEPVDGAINDRIDDAYTAKYKGSPYPGDRDLRLSWQTAGDGPTDLVGRYFRSDGTLHGFPVSSFMFRELIPRLASDYRVIAPDLPGFEWAIAKRKPVSHYRRFYAGRQNRPLRNLCLRLCAPFLRRRALRVTAARFGIPPANRLLSECSRSEDHARDR